MAILDRITVFLNKGQERSAAAKKNIAASLGLKGVNIVVSLVLVPMTINYVSPVQYGLWLTIAGMITWLSYFDFGFTQGFRNRFTEAVAKNDIDRAKELVSTTYVSLAALFFIVCTLFLFANNFIHWSTVLNIPKEYDAELYYVFAIMSIFFCCTFVAKTATTMLTADQKPALASAIDTIGQVTACLVIFILTYTTEGDLLKLAFVFSGLPCLILIIASFYIYTKTRYKIYAPSIQNFRHSLIRSIVGLGGKFFIIMLVMFCIIQVINLILTREQGPEAVAIYNIAYKYFNVLNMVFMIIVTPFWSAFSDAYTKKDFSWMADTLKKLERTLIAVFAATILCVAISPIVYKLWIGDSVTIPLTTTISVATYTFTFSMGGLYMFLINGTGKVFLQLVIYSVFAVISIPLMIYCCRFYGTPGVLLVPSLVLLTQSVSGRIQLRKLINGTANGIWSKEARHICTARIYHIKL